MRQLKTDRDHKARTMASALETLDRAISSIGIGTVSDRLVCHFVTVQRWSRRERTPSPFMASQILRVLSEFRVAAPERAS